MTTPKPTKAQVKIYTRPGCRLCDEAKGEMLSAACESLYELEEIDVDTDPELRRRYGWDIPVVVIDGALAFKHRLTREEFREELHRALNGDS
jgi:glutaredoxin